MYSVYLFPEFMFHPQCCTLPIQPFFMPKYSCAVAFLSFQGKMVEKLSEIIDNYKKCQQAMPFVLRSSYGCRMLREDGGPNRDFLAYLLCDHGFAVQFLKEVGLIRSKVQCNTCGRDMTWSSEPSIPADFRSQCRKKVAGVKCSA